MQIREANEQDWPTIYGFFTQIVEEGETYADPPGLSLERARPLWMVAVRTDVSWRLPAMRWWGQRSWRRTDPDAERTSARRASWSTRSTPGARHGLVGLHVMFQRLT